MDDFLKYLPLLNILIVPVIAWVIKIEKVITYIKTILETCEYCPGGTKHKKK